MTLLPLARAAVWFALLRLEAPAAEESGAWRVYESARLHVGIRPAASWGEGVGLTLQVSTVTPW